MATRRERVILDLEDNFSADMARAAASAALLNRELDSLNRRGSNSSGTDRVSESVAKIGKNTETSGKQIDKLSGRLALFAQAAAVLGPALVPIGAAAVPAIAGLATQLGFAGVAAGTTVLAFKGVGEALTAMNEYGVDPSAANLEKLNESMRNLGPAAREFVTYLHGIGPELQGLREAAQDGVLPGAEQGIRELMVLLPQAERVISNVADTVGDLFAEAGDNLNDPRWREFFTYLETDAAPILTQMGHTVGNFIDGLASLVLAFAPLTASFSAGFESMSRSFADWAANLSNTSGFQEFVSYIQTSGPQVLDLLGSLANLFVGIVTAAAPIGAVVLPALTALVDVFAAIAGSPVGAPLIAAAAGMAALSRATALFNAAKASSMLAFLTGAGPAGAAAGAGLSAAAAGAIVFGGAVAGDWLMGLSNANLSMKEMADNLELMAATGAATDTLNNMGFSVDSLGEKLHRAAFTDFADFFHQTDDIKDMDAALAGMDAGQAAEAFAVIQREATAAGVPLKDLTALFPKYTAAVADAAGRGNSLAELLGGPLEAALGGVADKAQEFQDAMQSVDEALSGRASFRSYQAALDDFADALERNGRAAGEFTAKGRENNQALDQIATSARAWADTLQGIDRVNFLANARRDFIKAAVDMGKTRTQAQHLATQLGLVDNMNPKVRVKVEGAEKAQRQVRDLGKQYGLTPKQIHTIAKLAGSEESRGKAVRLLRQYGLTPKQIRTFLEATDNASRKAKAARDAINGVPNKHVTITADTSQAMYAINLVRNQEIANKSFSITTNHVDNFTKFVKNTTGATGGLMHNGRIVRGYDSGGEVTGPGTATSDSIPAWLSNGEFVVKAAAVSRYGVDFMHELNAMRLAQGGFASMQRAQRGSASPTVSAAGFPDGIRIEGKVTITNPTTGEAYIRGIARSEVDGAASQSATLARQSRTVTR